MTSPSRTQTKRIVVPHPLLMAGSWAVIAGLVYWGFKTDFHQPNFWLCLPVSLLIVTFGLQSSRKRAGRQEPARPTASKRVLDIESR